MILFLYLIICILLSALFSAGEMAFVSTSKIRIQEQADHGDRRAKRLLPLFDEPHYFLNALLISNNVANIISAFIVTLLIKGALGVQSEILTTLLIAPILIIVCEMLPKDYARLHSLSVLRSLSWFWLFMERVFKFPNKIIMRILHSVSPDAGASLEKSIFVDEGEFRSLIEESMASGAVSAREKQIIDTILDFERKKIDSVMVPVDRIPRLELTSKIDDVKCLAKQLNTKMILIYEEIPSLIVGMIYVFDVLFEENAKEPLRKFLRSPVFLPQSTSVEKAFLTLQERRQSFAVATDSHGEVVGVVAIERLLAL